MQKHELQRYKSRLLEMRSRSRDEINDIVELVTSGAEATGEHDRKVSESVDKAIALEHSEEMVHEAILEALERIEQGTFGTCVKCGNAIPKGRLDALPFAACCVQCQREIEH